MDFWRSLPAESRIPSMIDVLKRYRELREGDRTLGPSSHSADYPLGMSFALSELIAAAYRLAGSREGVRLKMRPDEAQSLIILHSAFHTCGHGEDTKPPLELA